MFTALEIGGSWYDMKRNAIELLPVPQHTPMRRTERSAKLTAPGYWPNETGGELALAMKRYLEGQPLTVRDIALLRAYLRRWVDASAWDSNPHMTDESCATLALLRRQAREITTRDAIDQFVADATEFGMDPL
jgi:hypothetical protein